MPDQLIYGTLWVPGGDDGVYGTEVIVADEDQGERVELRFALDTNDGPGERYLLDLDRADLEAALKNIDRDRRRQ